VEFLSFHQQFQTFLPGITQEIILAETDPTLVMQQLDTGNLFNGGANALEVIKQYPGRFTSLHIKDAITLPENPRSLDQLWRRSVAKMWAIASGRSSNPVSASVAFTGDLKV